LCSALADTTDVGLGHTISNTIAIKSNEYYVQNSLTDGGAISTTANVGVVMILQQEFLTLIL
jgi:hypothetical protein